MHSPIGATTLGQILPSSMGPTTLDAVADMVAPVRRSTRTRRASKSPVLVLKREQMLAGGGEALAAGAIVEVEGEGC